MGLIGGMVKTAVVAGTASAARGRVARRQAEKFADRDQAITQNRAQGYAQGAQQTQGQPPSGPDAATQIKQLSELHDQGILTDEEFSAKKKQLLGI